MARKSSKKIFKRGKCSNNIICFNYDNNENGSFKLYE